MPNLLKARGIIQYRNELSVPEGAMDVADNIVIDEDDVVELRRGQGDFGDDLPLPENRVKQVTEYKSLLLRHYNSTLQFDNGSGTFSDFSGSYQELEDGLRIKYLEANGNFYFTDLTGIKKISARNSAQVTTDSIEDAGIPRAVSLDASVKYEIGGFLPPQSKVAYRVLWGKKDNNSNLLLGYPSERFVLTNTSDTVGVSESFTITVNAVPDNEDVITFGNSTDSYFLWFQHTASEEVPETSVTLGRTPVKVDLTSGSHTTLIVASKIANAIAGLAGFNVSIASAVVTVTLIETGDVENPEAYDIETPSTTAFTTSTLEQGSITEGNSANATISFTVPDGIDNTYFYQVYRTSSVTVPTGFTLDDIDPGDEMNLVFEGNPLDDEGILLTEVEIEDITPEDFRASADFLYTNPISGEGILQANARPPVAKDITLFNGSNFYANTKTTHKFTVNLVSVLNMVSGVSDFIVANEDITRRYTAVGATQVQDVTVNTAVLDEKAWFIQSARDERDYFVWYDEDGNGTQPSASPEFDNKISIRVRYSTNSIVDLDSTTSIDDVAETINITSHGLADGQELELITQTGNLPTGLSESTIYKVLVSDSDNIQVSLDGVNPVDITAATGTFTVKTYPTVSTIADSTAEALASTGDFSISTALGVMTITHWKNGVTSEAVESSLITDGNEMTFSTPSTIGDGEDLAAQEFLLSSQISVAASIDETARSLVKVINADPLSEINAYYLSGADDVPGIILLEARNLEDKPFYIGTSRSNISEDFDPSLSIENSIISTSINGTQTDVEFSSKNNLFLGQEIFIYDDGGILPFPNGKYEVKSIQTFPAPATNAIVTIDVVSLSGSSGVGAGLVANNESDNEESLNRLYFSKPFQPESVPLANFIDIGPRDKAILRILPLRDNLFALKEDGVYIISGTSAPNFTTRLLDSSVSILAPDSAVVLNNLIYALSDDGVVKISDTGVEVISRPIENLIKDVVNSRYNFETTSFGIAYSSDRSYLLWLPTLVSDTVATQCYRYNNFTRTWTRFTISATCGLVASRDDKMYLGAGDRNTLTQERKNNDRTDFADRDFTLSILPDSVVGTSLRVSSVTELDEGDVILQDQYVTVSVLRAILRKLDIDRKVRPITPSSIIDATSDIDGSNEQITVTSHGLNSNEYATVRLQSGTLPTGLVNNTTYRVLVIDSDNIQLSLNGTTPVNIEPSIGTFNIETQSVTYEESITVEAGIKVSTVVDALVDKLIADGIVVTDIITSDDLVTQRDQYNNLIDELNQAGSGTSFKNYNKAEDLVQYEMVVNSISSLNNQVFITFETPFVEGDITVFKGIAAKWQYAPQHFGDPSSLKQVRQGTIIFDQNSFYGGVIAYSSDQSADFIDTPFSGYGIGDWGTGIWGDGTWGGSGNDIPHRTLVPLEKQRCRYLTVQVRHGIAREIIRVNGISLMVRMISNRAYR